MTETNADAINRSFRTLAQGFVLTVLVAVVTALGDVFAAIDPEGGPVDWSDIWSSAWRTAVLAAGMAVVSYIHRHANDWADNIRE